MAHLPQEVTRFWVGVHQHGRWAGVILSRSCFASCIACSASSSTLSATRFLRFGECGDPGARPPPTLRRFSFVSCLIAWTDSNLCLASFWNLTRSSSISCVAFLRSVMWLVCAMPAIEFRWARPRNTAWILVIFFEKTTCVSLQLHQGLSMGIVAAGRGNSPF